MVFDGNVAPHRFITLIYGTIGRAWVCSPELDSIEAVIKRKYQNPTFFQAVPPVFEALQQRSAPR